MLILDEPTAGLDPRGQHEIMDMFLRLHRERGLTTVLVTHSMEDVAAYADRVVVMNGGSVYLKGTPQEVFSEPERLQRVGLDVPETIRFIQALEDKFGKQLPRDRFSLDEVTALVKELVGREEENR